MQEVTAVIRALAVAANPLMISFLSVFILKKKLTAPVIWALLLGAAGVVCAAWPLLAQTQVTAHGLLILFIGMLSYSAGALYFSDKDWSGLDLFTINGWQTLIGGLWLLPVALFII